MAAEDAIIEIGVKQSESSKTALVDGVADAVEKGFAKGIKNGLKALKKATSEAQADSAKQGDAAKARLERAASAVASASTLREKYLAAQDYQKAASAARKYLTPDEQAAVDEKALDQRLIKNYASGKISASFRLKQKELEQEQGGATALTDARALSLRTTLGTSLSSAKTFYKLSRDDSLPLAIRQQYARAAISRAETGLFAAKSVGDENSYKLAKAIIKNLARLDRSLISATKVLAPIATVAVSAAANFAGQAIPSIWGQRVTRDVVASQEAYIERQGMAAKAGGSIAGAIIGGAIGTLVAPGMGTVAGAAAGAHIGQTLASLWGERQKINWESAKKTRDVSLSVRKDMLTYGGKSGYAVGQALEYTGMGSAASLDQMRWSAETLPGRFMLGMVSEQEMYALSMMPEYFNALISGADGQTLAEAYRRSVDALPPALKPVVATMAPGGSRDMYSASRDPYFSQIMNAQGFRELERDAMFYSGGFASQATKNAIQNTLYQRDVMAEDVARLAQDPENMLFDTAIMSIRSDVIGALERMEEFFNLRLGPWSEGVDKLSNIGKTPINIVVEMDGVEVAKKEGVTIEDSMKETVRLLAGTI